jgi:hypothetical protein
MLSANDSAMIGGLPWLAKTFGYNPNEHTSDEERDMEHTTEEDKEGVEGADKRESLPGAKLGRTRSRSKIDQPDSAADRVFLVKAFQHSVDSERGRNFRNSLPKLKQYFVNKSNASQVFAFAFFWVSAYV